MGYQLLYYEDASLLPESRWFLWQWERNKGLSEPIELPVRTLLAEFKMPLRQGQATLLWLKNGGFIEATPIAKGLGRPSYTYRVAPWFLQDLATLPSEEPLLSANIERLSDCSRNKESITAKVPLEDLAESREAENTEEKSVNTELSSPEQPVERKGDKKEPLSVRLPNLFQSHLRKGQLTLANRWLLMVLLAHANEAGVVSTLSQSDLQLLTGLSHNRLYSQRRKLSDSGVLGRYTPGKAGAIGGQRRNAIYQIDLTYQRLANKYDWAVSVELLSAPSSLKHDCDIPLCEAIVAAMFEAVHTAGNKALSDRYRRAKCVLPNENFASSAWDVIRQLPLDRHLALWLRMLVHQAATQLMSTSWKALLKDNADRHVAVVTIKEALLTALTANEEKGKEDKVDESEESLSIWSAPNCAALASCLSILALHLATTLQKDLGRWQMTSNNASNVDLSELCYQLTPFEDTRDVQRGGVNPAYYWRLIGRYGSPKRTTSPDASDVPAHITFVVIHPHWSLPK